jgi:hypothetical protein
VQGNGTKTQDAVDIKIAECMAFLSPSDEGSIIREEFCVFAKVHSGRSPSQLFDKLWENGVSEVDYDEGVQLAVHRAVMAR